jgi:hypothetical protein
MHRSLNYALRGLFALSLLAPAAVLTTSPVAAASVAVAPVAAAQVVTSHIIAATTTCGNGLGTTPPDSAGRGLICNTTIANTITATGGSAVVTVKECYGSAGSPIDGTGPGGFKCVTDTSNLTSPVTIVTQCDGSITGGGGVLRCTVVVTTNFVNVSPSPGSSAASVNQCVGSGASGVVGVNIHCNPFPATTSGAAITQCNGSANGGTLVTPEGLTCAATGTMATGLGVTINQCNGSANGGGNVVNCSANMVTEVNGVVVGVGGGGGGGTAPPTSMVASGSTSNSSTPPFGLLIAFALAGLGLAVVLNRRRSAVK